MKYLIYLFYLLTLWLICTTQIVNAQLAKAKQNTIDALVEKWHSEQRFDGTVVIGNKQKILYKRAVGVANRTWQVPMQNDVVFDIASLNKAFIAALVLIAEEEGKLSLQDKLSQYFEGFPETITLHHMLCHISGLPNYDAIPDSLKELNYAPFKRLHFENQAYIDFIRGLGFVAGVEEKFHYSNFAFHLLPILIEETYSMPFDSVLQNKICRPLGMNSTYSSINNQYIIPQLAEAYNWQKDSTWQRNNFIDLTLGRRIFSTSTDLYRWARGLATGKLLSQASWTKMTQNHVGEIDKNVSYGYGWAVFDGKADYKMGNINIASPYLIHGGATEGYRAMLSIIHEGEWIITHLSNVGDRTNELNLTKEIAQILTK